MTVVRGWAFAFPLRLLTLLSTVMALLTVGGAASGASAVTAGPRGAGTAVRQGGPPPRFTFAPYLQDVTTDGVIVAFATDVPSVARVRVLPASVPVEIPAEAVDSSGVEVPVREEPVAEFLAIAATQHRIRVHGLPAGSRYRYDVTVRRAAAPPDAETATLGGELTTAPVGGPFTFLIYGDTRDRDGDHAGVVQAMVTEHPDFVLQTGDLVSRASDEGQWRRYFATAWPLLRNAPLYPSLGNHELRGETSASHFQRLFSLPRDRARRNRPVYYAFRYSNALFIALDGNSPYDFPQAVWLEAQLKAASADSAVRHVFVFIHQPPYAVGSYCGSQRIQQRLVPILQRYPVRAVFAGHEHAYQHLERGGIRYFVTGGGGAPLYPRRKSCNFEDDTALWMFRAEHHYLRVQVEGDIAVMTALDRRGNVMERVALHEPPREAPLMHQLEPDSPPGGTRPRLPLSPRLRRVPLLSLSPAVPGPSEGRRPAGALVLLGLSSVTVLAGLLVLVRPTGRRRRERSV